MCERGPGQFLFCSGCCSRPTRLSDPAHPPDPCNHHTSTLLTRSQSLRYWLFYIIRLALSRSCCPCSKCLDCLQLPIMGGAGGGGRTAMLIGSQNHLL